MLSLMAPAFMLLVAGAAQLGALAFLALYVASAGALYAVMYASFLQCRRAGVEFKPRHAASLFALIYVHGLWHWIAACELTPR